MENRQKEVALGPSEMFAPSQGHSSLIWGSNPTWLFSLPAAPLQFPSFLLMLEAKRWEGLGKEDQSLLHLSQAAWPSSWCSCSL